MRISAAPHFGPEPTWEPERIVLPVFDTMVDGPPVVAQQPTASSNINPNYQQTPKYGSDKPKEPMPEWVSYAILAVAVLFVMKVGR